LHYYKNSNANYNQNINCKEGVLATAHFYIYYFDFSYFAMYVDGLRIDRFIW